MYEYKPPPGYQYQEDSDEEVRALREEEERILLREEYEIRLAEIRSEGRFPSVHQLQDTLGMKARAPPEEEEKSQNPGQDEEEYEAYLDERGRIQYTPKAIGSTVTYHTEDPYPYPPPFRPTPQPTKTKETPSILQSDTWKQVVRKHEKCHGVMNEHEWPVEVRIMEMVVHLKRSIRCDAYIACMDLNYSKQEVADFRRGYAQTHATNEKPNTSIDSPEQLEATDDATNSPAIDEYP